MRRAIACAVVAGVFAGCGTETTERTYNDSLIRQVGAGSEAEAKLIRTGKSLKALGPFSDPKLEAAMQALLTGQLNKLTLQDLEAIDRAGVRDRERIPRAVAEIGNVVSALESARVQPGAYGDLSSGAHRFIVAWNQTLAGLASEVRKEGHDLLVVRGTFGEFHAFVLAASQATNSAGLARYGAVRARYLQKLGPVLEEVAGLSRSAVAKDLQRFSSLVNGNREAQVIVEKVNEQYPRGGLAETFKHG